MVGAGPTSGGGGASSTGIGPRLVLFFLTKSTSSSLLTAIAYDSRLRTAVGLDGGFLSVTVEDFVGAFEVAAALALDATVSFGEPAGAETFFAGVVLVLTPFNWD